MRTARALLAGLALALIAAACAGDGEQPGGSATATPAAGPRDATTVPTAASPRTPSSDGSRRSARVTRIVDGDTIDVEVEGREVTIRYIGIDTPETVAPGWPVECFGPEATARNRELVGGRQVELEKDISEVDRYGRALRYVYVDGRMVNEVLVAEGYARAVTFPPDVRYEDVFLAAEQRAREQGLGLWGVCGVGAEVPTPALSGPPPGATPRPGPAEAVIDPSCSQFDAPGDDNDTATEEYVCIRNLGGEAIEMTGWLVSDFGNRHTYAFPGFMLDAGAAMRLRTGCGGDTSSDLYWCAEGAVWNNGGDVVTLRDAAGDVVDVYSYEEPS